MKKVLIVIIFIALIAGVIFCVNSCQNKDDVVPENTPEATDVIPQNDVPDTENEVQPETKKPDTEDFPVYTGTGIYHGKIDSTFIEVLVDGVTPPLRSCKLSPELAEKFSSLNLELGAIITFEYQLVDDQYVIKSIS